MSEITYPRGKGRELGSKLIDEGHDAEYLRGYAQALRDLFTAGHAQPISDYMKDYASGVEEKANYLVDQSNRSAVLSTIRSRI